MNDIIKEVHIVLRNDEEEVYIAVWYPEVAGEGTYQFDASVHLSHYVVQFQVVRVEGGPGPCVGVLHLQGYL